VLGHTNETEVALPSSVERTVVLPSKLLRWTLRLLSFCLVGYVVILALAWVFQRDLLYRPQAVHIGPAGSGLTGVNEVILTTEDGVRITAWHSPAPTDSPTIVYFHGTGGALTRFKGLMRRIQKAGYGAVFVSYRGYAGSEGAPSENGLYADGRATLAWLNGQGIPPEQIFLYGHSLGSGVVVKLASERNFAGVILAAPYTSTVDVASLYFPFLPVDWLMSDRFDSLSRIDEVRSPIFIMHGGRDSTIPQRMGQALFDAANDPKVGYFPADADHSDLHLHGGWDKTIEFVEAHRPKATQ
jgi:uncharacterized protein